MKGAKLRESRSGTPLNSSAEEYYYTRTNLMTDICGLGRYMSVFGSHVDPRDWSRDGFIVGSCLIESVARG